MRLYLIPFALLAAFLALPSKAQTIDVFVRGVAATREGTTHVHGGVATVALNSARGVEAGADVFWSRRISTELSVSSVHHELDASAFGENVDLGGTRFMPISAILEWHTDPRGAFDVHLGAGAAFVTFGEVTDNAELTLLGVRSIKFHNKVALLFDAGAAYRFGPHWAITADAKLFDIKTKTTATYLDGSTEGAKLNVNQLSLGAGVSYRF
ncbi:MAG: OmpW family outer membrane protein [Acidobacteriota bacterium]